MAMTPEQLMNSIVDSIKGIASIGDGIDFDSEVETIPTGIDLLDYILGGGVPVGKLCTITGSPGGGKTSLAAQYIAGFQHYDPNSLAWYLDIEQGLSKDRLVQLGCDPTRTKILSKTLSVEGVTAVINNILSAKVTAKQKEVPWIIIWDSESSTPTDAMLKAEKASATLGEKSRTFQFALNKLIPSLAACHTTLIVIAQLRNNIVVDKYAPKKAELNLGTQKITGGSAGEYLPFQLAFIKTKGQTGPEAKNENCIPILGQANEISFIKNKNFIPRIPVELVIDYDSGYSDFWTKERLLRKEKCFAGTAWQTLPGCSVKHHRADVKTTYDENEEFKSAFDTLYEQKKKELLTLRSTKKKKEVESSDLSEEDQNLLKTLNSDNNSESEESVDFDNFE